LPREHPLGAKIQQQQRGVAVAGDKGYALRRIDEQTVVMLAA
jgi:hypothetical protein